MTEPTLPLWLEYIKALGPTALGLGTLALGISALQISKRQSEISREQASTASRQAAQAAAKLRLELFDRRMQIIEAARSLAYEVAVNNALSHETYISYCLKVRDARWIFDDVIHDFIQSKIEKSCFDLRKFQRLLRDEPLSPKRSEWADGEAESAESIKRSFDELTELVRPFMNLKAEDGKA